MDNLEILIGFAITMGGIIVSITNWLNSKIAKLQEEINHLNNRFSIQDTQIEGKLMNLELRVNGNFELIGHRTQRFSSEMDRARERVDRDLNNVQNQINQISGWLDKTTDFRPRG